MDSLKCEAPVYLQVGNPGSVMAPEGAAGEEAPQVDWPTAREWREQLPANQVATENEE